MTLRDCERNFIMIIVGVFAFIGLVTAMYWLNMMLGGGDA